MKPIPPAAPSALEKRTAATVQLEADRAERFATWKVALEVELGNIVRAGEALGATKGAALSQVRRLGLSTYAAELRRVNGQPVMGRPRGTTKIKK